MQPADPAPRLGANAPPQEGNAQGRRSLAHGLIFTTVLLGSIALAYG